MHEMALAESMLEIVEDTARRNGAARVKTVWLEIGALSHVAPEALRFCFDAVTRGGIADGAQLTIVATPGRGVVHALRRDGAAGAAGRRLPALRQPSAHGRPGRGDAGQGNRDRVNGGAPVTHGLRRSDTMCTTCGCGEGDTRIEGKAVAPAGAHWHRHDDGTVHSHADGTLHSHVHGGGSAHERAPAAALLGAAHAAGTAKERIVQIEQDILAQERRVRRARTGATSPIAASSR